MTPPRALWQKEIPYLGQTNPDNAHPPINAARKSLS